MMVKIEHVQDLPEWFSLDKYQDTKTFSAADWFTALAIRQDILSIVESRNTSEDGAFDFKSLIPVIEGLRCFPLDASPRRGHWEYIPDRVSLAKMAPVRPLTIFDVAWRASEDRDLAHLTPHGRQKADRWQIIVDDGLLEASLSEQPEPIFLDWRGSGAPIAAVWVDLAAQDSVLLEAFALWLKSARTAHPATRRERPAYNDWVRYGLLPYIDLLTWAIETGNQIPHNIMAQAVGYFRGGDSFRKTVPGLAANLMRSNLAELETLAALEARQENPGS